MADPIEPTFRSVHAALAFAFNFTHGSLKKNILAQGGGSGSGLSGLDGAAQAGLIKSSIEALPELQRYVLVARFAPKSSPCDCNRACCRGWVWNPEWDDAVAWLTEHVLEMGLTGTISHHRFRRALVAKYFGFKVSFVDIAAQCGVDRHTASEQHENVERYFQGKPPHYKGVEWRALVGIEGRLKAAGVVE